MMKLMSMVMSLELGLAATVTDVDGKSIEIEDTLETVYTMDSTDFDTEWYTMDDRVMGGASYSYINYESATSDFFPNGYGKFYGTANSTGGGFSLIANIDQSQSTTDMYTYPELYDLSDYDGL